MRTEEIRFVTEVCRTGSMASAARNLNITPQGLGKAIQKLEKELGVKLFVRTFEGVFPTPVCNQIYNKLNDIVNTENAIREIIGQTVPSGKEEEVFMVSANTVGIYVEAAVKEYNEKFNKNIRLLEVLLSDEQQEQAFMENKYTYRYCCQEDVQNKILLREEIVKLRYVLLAGRGSPLIGKEFVTYKDLSETTLLVEDLHYPHIRVLLGKFDALGIPKPAIKCVTINAEIIALRLRSDPSAVYFARARDTNQISQFDSLNFYPPFYTTMCLETHNKTMNRRLLKILREKMKDYNTSQPSPG